jgi:hypothetical protein
MAGPLLFPSPNTPDLGCFVRRKHGLETGDDFRNIHVDLNPSIDFHPEFHQAYFRVSCGEAAFFQRCLVYMRPDASRPPFPGEPPDFILGGDFTPHPSDWQKFPTQGGQRFYYFLGQHRNPQQSTWQADALTGHSYDIYTNGTLSTVQYDDTGGDRDLNDLVVEVAVVGRLPWVNLPQAIDQDEITTEFAKLLPRLRDRLHDAA